MAVTEKLVFPFAHTEAAEGWTVTAVKGFTVTVILDALPTQLPVTEVGTTLYTMLPATVAEGLVNTWLMAVGEPVLADAPEMLPVLVPNVQV